MHNHVIDELTPSAATARCYFGVTGLSRQMKEVRVTGNYTDALVKTEGRWRSTSRQATFVAFFTLPVANRVVILLTSVRTEADRVGSSSARTSSDVSVSLAEASSWRCVAWWLVPLASTTQGRVHATRRSRSY
jgi:hypothetical protein